LEIEKAVEAADAILVCLSNNSITKEGYVQRELRIVLDYADYKPEGTLYIIPVRLEQCEPPRRLRAWQYADYLEGQRDRALQRLLVSLKRRADSLDLKVETPAPEKQSKPVEEKKPIVEKSPRPKVVTSPPVGRIANPTYANKITLSNGMEFMRVPAGRFLMGSTKENKLADDDERPQHTVDIPYDYWLARFPVTNELYNAYVKVKDIKHPVDGWEKKKDHPVVYVKWEAAVKYCQWLNNLLKGELPSGLLLGLPTEAEWEKAARGEYANEWPWGNEFDENKGNFAEGRKGKTTPVGTYSPQGDSPYGCADMVGNVWEWTYSYSLFNSNPYRSKDEREDKDAYGRIALRGCSSTMGKPPALFTDTPARLIVDFDSSVGFRVVASPNPSLLKILKL